MGKQDDSSATEANVARWEGRRRPPRSHVKVKRGGMRVPREGVLHLLHFWPRWRERRRKEVKGVRRGLTWRGKKGR